MIKKIICPTDFSNAAINATEYAAKFAQVFDAELILTYIQKITIGATSVNIGESLGTKDRENALIVSEKLKEMSTDINKIFNISTNYGVDITTDSLKTFFSSIDEENTMIVMGTNGVDTIYEYFFGTNTYQVIKKTKCPVLVIPEKTSYGSLQKIVIAWDYKKNNNYFFPFISDLIKLYNLQVVFLHISKNKTEIEKEVFDVCRNEILSAIDNDKNIEFEHLFSDKITDSLNSYMINSKADMLSITYYERGLIANVFHDTIVKELCENATYPILVIHA